MYLVQTGQKDYHILSLASATYIPFILLESNKNLIEKKVFPKLQYLILTFQFMIWFVAHCGLNSLHVLWILSSEYNLGSVPR